MKLLREYIRELLIEQEVKFSGILKLMPSPAIVSSVSSLLQQLPPEAVPLPEDKFHVTLAHQSVLKPYKKQLKQQSILYLCCSHHRPIRTISEKQKKSQKRHFLRFA